MTDMIAKLFLFGVGISGFTLMLPELLYSTAPIELLLYTSSILCVIYSGKKLLKG